MVTSRTNRLVAAHAWQQLPQRDTVIETTTKLDI
jgi:hypothetical protein